MNSAELHPEPDWQPGAVDPTPGHAVLPSFLMTGVVIGLGVVFASTALAPAGFGPAIALPVLVFLAMTGFAAASLRASYPHHRLGLCNLVTYTRGGMVAVLTVPMLTPGLLATDIALAWIILAIASLALALDGIDGWLARRQNLVSAFGARFDMEIDSVLALVLAVLALQSGKAGIWVLALGLMRYVYIAAGMALPWLRGNLPERFSRKLICVIQIGVLIVLNAPIIAPPLSYGLAAIATALLVWSFAVDIIWLARRK